ncbi:MAG TPA: hypothetical protein VMS88_04935 [Terriglobales bacterium]|nr:hypothetical protein [Terriglobales bacterium]
MPRTLSFAFFVTLLFVAPSWARPWTIGGGGGFQMNQYQVNEYDALAFQPNGTLSVFAETPLAPTVALRAVGAYAWYVWDRSIQTLDSGSHPSWPSMGIASFGTTVRIRMPGRRRTAPYAEAGPVLCWSRWHDRPAGYYATNPATRASMILPGLQWGAGFEVRPVERVRMEFGLTGLVTSAPGKVDLPLFAGESVRGVHQVALTASLGWRI